MENCHCGAELHTYWVWNDGNGVQHASSFKPSQGAIQSVLATTSRDALIPLAGIHLPKHDVRSFENPSQLWQGRCGMTLARTAVAV